MKSVVTHTEIGRESSTLVELLVKRAYYQPHHQAYTFLVDGEETQIHLSYAELDRKARAIGGKLQTLGVSGSNILLLFPSGLEFVAAFFGCLYAGCCAVPCYPPRVMRSKQNAGLERFIEIGKDVNASVILASPDVKEFLQEQISQQDILQNVQYLSLDEIADEYAEVWKDPGSTGDSIAFLQYTSGSTSIPKGVILTHTNLLVDMQMLRQIDVVPDECAFVSWLPIYHDMGLIGTLLEALYVGKPCVFMTPLHFLQKPARWLNAITQYKNVISGGPNFAYDLCVQKVTPEQLQNIDLSSWYVAFVGSDPIRPHTLKAFTNKFISYGFRQSTYLPCYGLAEATLFVSGNRITQPLHYRLDTMELGYGRVKEVLGQDTQSKVFVGCGVPCQENRVVIVDPQTFLPCPSNHIGEIWISGSNVAKGYWHRSEQTKNTFECTIPGTGDVPFLRTGDLGFLAQEQLVVTGRLKDLIIIRGRNIYPQDIEMIAERAHPALKESFNAAFSIDVAEEEQLCLVQAVETLLDIDVDTMAEDIRKAVASAHSVDIHTIVFVRPSAIPKTTSGKIRRQDCRIAFLSGNLKALTKSVHETTSVNDSDSELVRQTLLSVPLEERRAMLETLLRKQIGQVLGTDPEKIDVESPLTELGMDSLTIVHVHNWLCEVTNKKLPVHRMFEYPNIHSIVSQIVGDISEKNTVHAGYDRASKQRSAILRQKRGSLTERK